ncbi:MAG: diaminopimelate decarboxylase family protein [Candidatus Hodarchaeota archaeon]
MKKISGNPYLREKNGKVLVDLLSIDEFLDKFDTPLMIFLENRLKENLTTFKDVFGSIFNHKKFQAFYSLKANFLPDICKIICSEDLGAQIVGLPELKLALKVGFPTNKIIVGGPYLPKELIKKSIEYQVKEIIVYNLNDLKDINLIAQKLKRIQKICLRINSQKYDSKLGIKLDVKTQKKLKDLINKYRNIKITTVLSHYSSQMNNIDQYKKNIQAIAENVRILSKINLKCENINLGGGFPEATVMPKNQLEKIGISIKTTIDELGIDYEHIYFEPGRYFVGDTGLFLTKIVKVTEDRWIFLNIGNHICPKFARCSLRFYNISQINEPHKYKTSIAGILPTDQDVLVKNYFFTKDLIEKDFVLVSNVGAYTLTFSNRFPYSLPKIILVKDNNFKQIFNPSSNKDISIN